MAGPAAGRSAAAGPAGVAVVGPDLPGHPVVVVEHGQPHPGVVRRRSPRRPVAGAGVAVPESPVPETPVPESPIPASGTDAVGVGVSAGPGRPARIVTSNSFWSGLSAQPEIRISGFSSSTSTWAAGRSGPGPPGGWSTRPATSGEGRHHGEQGGDRPGQPERRPASAAASRSGRAAAVTAARSLEPRPRPVGRPPGRARRAAANATGGQIAGRVRPDQYERARRRAAPAGRRRGRPAGPHRQLGAGQPGQPGDHQRDQHGVGRRLDRDQRGQQPGDARCGPRPASGVGQSPEIPPAPGRATEAKHGVRRPGRAPTAARPARTAAPGSTADSSTEPTAAPATSSTSRCPVDPAEQHAGQHDEAGHQPPPADPPPDRDHRALTMPRTPSHSAAKSAPSAAARPRAAGAGRTSPLSTAAEDPDDHRRVRPAQAGQVPRSASVRRPGQEEQRVARRRVRAAVRPPRGQRVAARPGRRSSAAASRSSIAPASARPAGRRLRR